MRKKVFRGNKIQKGLLPQGHKGSWKLVVS